MTRFRILERAEDFSHLKNAQTGRGAHPASYTVCTGVLSQETKDLSCGFHHAPPSNAELRNEWSYTPTPAICLYGVDGENFNFFVCIKQ
jgi:hypothetical protein